VSGGDEAPCLEIEVASTQPPRFVLRGEIDLAAMPLCEEVIEPSCEHRTTVTLDLSGVTFVDSSGLRALVRIHRICDAAGGRLELVDVQPQVGRVLTVSGLDQLFTIHGATLGERSGP
jgi:anti-anti-sigma factor